MLADVILQFCDSIQLLLAMDVQSRVGLSQLRSALLLLETSVAHLYADDGLFFI